MLTPEGNICGEPQFKVDLAGTSPSDSSHSMDAHSPRDATPYRCFKLTSAEIRRRELAGTCTYCDKEGHTRPACAVGRLMRKVPKWKLASRLRENLCPLCGDPDRDDHTKEECPLKLRLEKLLALKKETATLRLAVKAFSEINAQRENTWNSKAVAAAKYTRETKILKDESPPQIDDDLIDLDSTSDISE